MHRILFVCHGNICRSPMAEFILKDLVSKRGLSDSYYIESAAVSEEELGNPIYPPAKRCLKQHGIWFDSCKTARRITREDYDRFDRIICMDHSNLRWLSHIFDECFSIASSPFVTSENRQPKGKTKDASKNASKAASKGDKVCLMMSWCGSGKDVADPWYTGDFELTYRDILQGCKAMLEADEALLKMDGAMLKMDGAMLKAGEYMASAEKCDENSASRL